MDSSQAYLEVNKAIKAGLLVRLDTCELCNAKGRTVTHHYNGYDKPLDVWHICYSCNISLAGRHDGSLTLEQAREFITQRNLKRGWQVNECYRQTPEYWRVLFRGTELQARKRYQTNLRRRSFRYGVALLDPFGEVVEIFQLNKSIKKAARCS